MFAVGVTRRALLGRASPRDMGRHSIGATTPGANIPKPLFHQATFRESACLEISVDPLQNLAPSLTCSLQQNLGLTRET